jgi:hypothetical protein
MQSRKLLSIVLSSSLLMLLPSAWAQVHESAVGANRHIWVGAEFSHFNPDYGLQDLDGVGIYADTMVTGKFGAELDARFLVFNKFQGETEKDFLIGPTYQVYRRNRLTVNAKILAGVDTVNYPSDIGYGSYFAYAPGGDVEYQIDRRFRVRGGYEFDFLPSAPGFPDEPSNGLTPHGFNIGVSYRVF